MLGQQVPWRQDKQPLSETDGHGLDHIPIDDDELQDLIDQVKDYQLTHGFLLKLVRVEEPTTVLCRPVNVSIIPTAFPGSLFDRALDLQKACNQLYIHASSDSEWLHSVLQPLLKEDGLAKSLWQIWSHVRDAGVAQDVVCGIFRSDYMLHQPASERPASLKQVEMNTFSVAGACHAERAANMHKHLKGTLTAADSRRSGVLPTSENIAKLTNALRAAHRTFEPRTSHRTCILMITQPINFNVADERPMEYGLQGRGIACYRCNWQDVLEQTTLCDDRTLLFHRTGVSFEVSLVYYRAGYEAGEYDLPGRETRLRLELSRAIKCPDILTHLTTFKVVQLALAAPGVLERFLSQEAADALRPTFMDMHALSSSEALAIARNPDQANDYVLKPNLEGGGHNIFRNDIPDFVETLAKEQYADYVLMKMIQPQFKQGVLMTPQELYQGPVVSELGVIGTCLWRRSADGREPEVIGNEAAGWTFKSKPSSVDEMSVVKGYGCFDCPLLTDNGCDVSQ